MMQMHAEPNNLKKRFYDHGSIVIPGNTQNHTHRNLNSQPIESPSKKKEQGPSTLFPATVRDINRTR